MVGIGKGAAQLTAFLLLMAAPFSVACKSQIAVETSGTRSSKKQTTNDNDRPGKTKKGEQRTDDSSCAERSRDSQCAEGQSENDESAGIGDFTINEPEFDFAERTIVLSWTEASGASSYEVSFRKTSCQGQAVSSATVSESSTTFQVPQFGSYYACVSASGEGEGEAHSSLAVDYTPKAGDIVRKKVKHLGVTRQETANGVFDAVVAPDGVTYVLVHQSSPIDYHWQIVKYRADGEQVVEGWPIGMESDTNKARIQLGPSGEVVVAYETTVNEEGYRSIAVPMILSNTTTVPLRSRRRTGRSPTRTSCSSG